jgi:CubicO group peptidase (beta-lactamase class C family)
MLKTSNAGGLSQARLGRMHDVMAGHIEAGEMPGMVTLVSRGGETHVDTLGHTAIGGAPMQRDTIFRITSMTKPVTAVAAMILIEECKLRLDDPVDPWLPELAKRNGNSWRVDRAGGGHDVLASSCASASLRRWE